MQISITDGSGRTTEVVPPLLGVEDDIQKETALRYHMMKQADLVYSMTSGGMIEPARAKIWQEHYISAEVLLPFVEQSSFVPPGHEKLFAKGLAAGMEGDFATALHLLIPQSENALREMLKRMGYVVNTKEKDDHITQEALSINAILAHEGTREALDEGTLFDLKSLLLDRLGSTWRHAIAHGIVSDFSFQKGSSTTYIFWLILRLIILPLIPENDSVLEATD